jgi:hypothetical protein
VHAKRDYAARFSKIQRIMPPRFHVSGEVGVGPRNFEIVHTLRCCVERDRENRQFLQSRVPDHITSDQFTRIDPTFTDGKQRMLGRNAHARALPFRIFQRQCHCTLINQILRIGRLFGGFCTLNYNISTGFRVSA